VFRKPLTLNEAFLFANEPKGILGASSDAIAGNTPSLSPRPAVPRPTSAMKLRLLVNSRHPIITVETPEKERLERCFSIPPPNSPSRSTTGAFNLRLAKAHGAAIYNTEIPSRRFAISR